MIPGRQVHDPANAARGFDKLMTLFDDSLRSSRTAKSSQGRPFVDRTADAQAMQRPYA
jgi:hypothetical protein